MIWHRQSCNIKYKDIYLMNLCQPIGCSDARIVSHERRRNKTKQQQKKMIEIIISEWLQIAVTIRWTGLDARSQTSWAVKKNLHGNQNWYRPVHLILTSISMSAWKNHGNYSLACDYKNAMNQIISISQLRLKIVSESYYQTVLFILFYIKWKQKQLHCH